MYYADFSVPPSIDGEYLYLIWDLRDAILEELCYGGTLNDSCCNCTPGNYYLNASFSTATSVFEDINLTTLAPDGFYSLDGIVRELLDGVLLPSQPCGPCSVEASLCFGSSAEDVCCYCNETCATPYNYYLVGNNEDFEITVYFYNQDGVLSSFLLGSESSDYICSIGAPYSDSSITVVFLDCNCGL